MSNESGQEDQTTGRRDNVAGKFHALGLSNLEIAALKRQGSVIGEKRGSRVVYKLRYRMQGRQRTKYLGCDLEMTVEIKRQLEELQHSRRVMKSLRDYARIAAATLRQSKKQLEPLFADAGFRFHGQAIRRSRL